MSDLIDGLYCREIDACLAEELGWTPEDSEGWMFRCRECSGLFVPSKSNQRTCSDRCRQRRHRRQLAEPASSQARGGS